MLFPPSEQSCTEFWSSAWAAKPGNTPASTGKRQGLSTGGKKNMPPAAAEKRNKDSQAQTSRVQPPFPLEVLRTRTYTTRLQGTVAQPPEGSCAHPRGSPSSVGTVSVHAINILFLCSLQAQGTKLSHKKVLLLMKNSCPEGRLLRPTWPVFSPRLWPAATSMAAAMCCRRLPPPVVRAPRRAQRRGRGLGTTSKLLEELLRLSAEVFSVS